MERVQPDETQGDFATVPSEVFQFDRESKIVTSAIAGFIMGGGVHVATRSHLLKDHSKLFGEAAIFTAETAIFGILIYAAISLIQRKFGRNKV